MNQFNESLFCDERPFFVTSTEEMNRQVSFQVLRSDQNLSVWDSEEENQIMDLPEGISKKKQQQQQQQHQQQHQEPQDWLHTSGSFCGEI